MNKKAIELSVNFLVMLILAIVIFGLGIKFIHDIVGQSESLRDLTLSELDNQIEDLLCDSTDKVCIGTNTRTMNRGDIHIFGIRVVNMDDAQHEFTVSIQESGYLAEGSNSLVSFSSDDAGIEFKPTERIETINAHEEKDMGIGFQVGNKIASGKYIFTVTIDYDYNPGGGTGGGEYDAPKKIYITVP